jgi:hypothetical protein
MLRPRHAAGHDLLISRILLFSADSPGHRSLFRPLIVGNNPRRIIGARSLRDREILSATATRSISGIEPLDSALIASA